jgi:hypothetical protein
LVKLVGSVMLASKVESAGVTPAGLFFLSATTIEAAVVAVVKPKVQVYTTVVPSSSKDATDVVVALQGQNSIENNEVIYLLSA